MDPSNSYRRRANKLLRKKAAQELYFELVSELYRDIAECYSVTLKVQRTELAVMRARFAKEGISFLTKSLPLLSKAVDTALSSGTLLKVVGWKTNGSAIPLFLGWLLSRVFDASGKELDRPDPYAFKHFRQLCTLLYKLEMPYAKKTENKVLEAFVQTDQSLPKPGSSALLNRNADSYCFRRAALRTDEWINTARALVARAVSPLDPDDIIPRHGPGAVATGECAVKKSNLRRIYKSLETVYPFTEWMMLNANHIAMSIPAENPEILLLDEATAKVVLVPKDSRGPRLISCEPLEIQWIQQGLGRALVEQLETSKWTKGFVNFTDQEVNRKLALQASKDGLWVTLDMKDASDRVSLSLVETLFQDHPKLLSAITAARSSKTRLPCGTEVPLNKYAPMGSALCFPVEALVFWALSVSAITHTNGIPLREARKCVYVYGDDIIVRESDYTALLQCLPQVGLKFNESKCCVARSFRESCGCDAYQGVDVTPVKLKTTWIDDRKEPKCLESYVAFYNAMYGLGHFRVANAVKHQLERIYGKIPYTNAFVEAPNGAFRTTSGGIHYVCHEQASKRNKEDSIRTRFNARRQSLQVRTWATTPCRVRRGADSYQELLRSLSRTGLLARNVRRGPEDSRRSSHQVRNAPGVGSEWLWSRYGPLNHISTEVGENIDNLSVLIGHRDLGFHALVRRNRLKRTWADV